MGLCHHPLHGYSGSCFILSGTVPTGRFAGLVTTPDKNRGQELEAQIARLEAQLVEDPDTTAFSELSDLYTRAGRLLDAIQVCRDGLKLHPRLAAGHVSLGRALFGSGNLPVAAKVLHRSLALEDVKAESFRLLGEIMLRLSRPAEAVKLLERAQSRGFNERSIAALLKKARAAHVSSRRARAVSEGDRGLGNVAISGTINTQEEETRPMPALSGEELKEQAGGAKATVGRAPGVKQGLAPRVKTDLSLRRLPLEIFRVAEEDPKQGWSSIDDAWEKTLDASQVRSRSRPAVKTPTPGFEPMDVPVAPLTDPLAEGPPPRTGGMPPVPEDAGEEDSTAAYPEADTFPMKEELVPTVPDEPSPLLDELAVPPTEDIAGPALHQDAEATPRLQEFAATDAVSSSGEHLTVGDEDPVVPAEPPREERTSPFEGMAPVEQEAHETEPRSTVPVQADAGEGVGSLDAAVESRDADGIEEALEDELGLTPSDEQEDAPTIRFVRVPEDELFLEDAAPPEEQTEAISVPVRARRGRLLLLLFILGVLLLFGVGAALGWYLFEHQVFGQQLPSPAPLSRVS